MPNAESIFFIHRALRDGFTIDEIFNLTKIDRWFLGQIKEIVDFEEELAASKNWLGLKQFLARQGTCAVTKWVEPPMSLVA